MNTKRFKQILIISFISIISHSSLANGKIEYHEIINKEDISVSDTIINNLQCIYLSYLKQCPILKAGELISPGETLNFSVPANSTSYSIDINAVKYDSIPILNNALYAFKEDPQFELTEDVIKFGTHSYKTSNNLTKFCNINSSWFSGGFNKVVSLTLSAFSYDIEQGYIYILKEISLNLNWENSITESYSERIIPSQEEFILEKILHTQSIVVNPTDVRKNSQINNTDRLRVPSNDVIIDYLIITNRQLMPAFKRLEAIRKLKGFTTKIVAIEDIIADPKYANGDVISGINDSAGKLREFLKESYAYNGTKYVLLGGKYPNFPVRDGSSSEYSEVLNTDLYFAELNEKWNKNKTYSDTYYPSFADMDCELAVGRLNCSTAEEVNNYIDKLWIYEFNPGNGHPEYLDNGYVYVYEEMEKSYTNNIKNLYLSCFENLTEFIHSEDKTVKGAEIITHFNNNNYGYIDFQCHGNPEGVALSGSEKYGIPTYGVNALDNETLHHSPEIGNGLDCMKNKYYPNWSHSMSCTLMPFKNILSEEKRDLISYNFGESYTLGKEYGGIAFIGNTKDGYITPSNKFQACFFNRFYELGKTQMSNVGNILNNSRYAYSQQLSITKNLFLKLNLFGDPCVHLWHSCPDIITNKSGKLDLTKINYSNNYRAIVYDVFNDKINKYSINNAAELNNILTYNTSNKIVSIFSPNSIPVILSFAINDLSLQSEKFIVCQDAIFGSESNSNIEFNSGCDLTIYANDNVSFDNGVKCKKDSKVSVYSKRIVSVKNTQVNSGAQVNFRGNKIVLESGTKIYSKANLSVEPVN